MGRGTSKKELMKEDLYLQWKKDEAAVFQGWDFSYLRGRIMEEAPSWDYMKLAAELVRKSTVLDMATGGGERFSTLAPFARHAVAIEGYTPNVAVARRNLEPLGVKVMEADEAKLLPFSDNEFDLVLNRHGAFKIEELFRILKPGGCFLSQQVAGDNALDLLNAFDEKAKWPEMMLPLVKPRFEAIGFKVKRAEAWKGRVVFRDLGALVYWLKAVPWAVDNFSVDSHLGYLGRLQERVDIEGVLKFTYSRYLIFVWKPVGFRGRA